MNLKNEENCQYNNFKSSIYWQLFGIIQLQYKMELSIVLLLCEFDICNSKNCSCCLTRKLIFLFVGEFDMKAELCLAFVNLFGLIKGRKREVKQCEIFQGDFLYEPVTLSNFINPPNDAIGERPYGAYFPTGDFLIVINGRVNGFETILTD
jgi:hypothetical protein